MTKILIDEATVKLALDDLIACEEKIDSEWGDCRKMDQIDRDGDTPDSIIALRQAIADAALDKMAENARELGLSYEQPAQETDPDALTAAYMSGVYEGKKRRPWVGLNASDLAEIPPSCYGGAIWADARLKEKNT